MSTSLATDSALRPRPARAPRKRALWRDPQGHVSTLKSVALAALFLPAIVIAAQWSLGLEGPRATTQVIHGFGLWTIRLLWLTLFISPLAATLHWPRLLLIRRMLGVACALYGATHLGLYIFDEQGKLLVVASEIASRFYLTIGFVALLGLGALAVTSTDGWVRKLRGNWVRLHRLIYPVALLALWHMALQSKADVSEAVWMAGLLTFLLGWRLLARAWRTRQLALWPLAIGAGLVAAFAEAAWYAVRNHVDPLRVLAINFDPDNGIRPPLAAALLLSVLVIAAIARNIARRRAS